LKKSPPPIKIESKIIKILYDSLLPFHYRLNSILEDVVEGRYSLSEMEKAVLLEHASCSLALKNIFEDYFDQMTEASVEQVFVKEEEYTNLLSMAKTVESSSRMLFSNFGLWSH